MQQDKKQKVNNIHVCFARMSLVCCEARMSLVCCETCQKSQVLNPSWMGRQTWWKVRVGRLSYRWRSLCCFCLSCVDMVIKTGVYNCLYLCTPQREMNFHTYNMLDRQTNIHKYLYMFIYTYVYIHVSMYVSVCLYVYICIYTYTHKYIICKLVLIRVHVYVHGCKKVSVHTNMSLPVNSSLVHLCLRGKGQHSMQSL
jgi:hypothetical protein